MMKDEETEECYERLIYGERLKPVAQELGISAQSLTQRIHRWCDRKRQAISSPGEGAPAALVGSGLYHSPVA